MSIKKEILNGPGYSIFKIEKMKVFAKLRNEIIKKLNLSLGCENNINSIRKKLTQMSNAEINKSMINLLKFNDLSEMVIKSCPKTITALCGKELFIQRRAHVVVKIPGKKQLKTLPHYEMMSGISPHSFVMWFPLHDLEKNDGGIYYVNQKDSLSLMKNEEEKEGLVNGPKILDMRIKKKSITMSFGEAILFNPFVLHGNNNFNSNLARIAVNVRFQSFKKPLLQKNSDYLTYYKLN